ncbi:hypothetical protein NDK47_13905 [Brevibacillus ruminantium]|uniref:Uncharacterized protein n=1 Tax=Brevibacillus ruminantium TaxID=2950604 RepID=A0ABY4W920_9BACL|nr:hypothetical protein [Brevibacillus ruminantium]USG63284.1 hypothetical protein NDK47_13905 [Brevibacillus ruminantium]
MTGNEKVRKALADTLERWAAMTRADIDDAESTADTFEASFYSMMEAIREWSEDLEDRPRTVEAFMELPLIAEIAEQMPAPLLLNFETEAELIVAGEYRIDEDKYD